jgi:hypothetical protein
MEHTIGTRSEVVARLATHFSRLLQIEGLEPDDFLKPISEYDEVPLYTRLERVAFLSGFSHEARNTALLALALEFLERVLARAKALPAPRLAEFFVMITVMDWEDYHAGRTVTPCFWVTTRASQELGPMRLVPPFTDEATRVKRWLSDLSCGSSYLVGDHPITPVGFPLRVHIGPAEAASAGMREFSGLFPTAGKGPSPRT